MTISRRILGYALAAGILCGGASAHNIWAVGPVEQWVAVDDDVARNVAETGFFSGIEIADYRFSENGFDWHLIRFTNTAKPYGPLWLVPHDDENAAFDAMIAALKEHGGVGVAVNSGNGSARMQSGYGRCGVDVRKKAACDPNRNFDSQSPAFTSTILDQRPIGQPVIALHTNSPGFAGDGQGGRGDISIVDQIAFRQGKKRARKGALLAVNPIPLMANYDTLGLVAYARAHRSPSAAGELCGRALSDSGIHFWHEDVGQSDGSMSNYLALNEPDIAYFNAESRAEADLAIAASRHLIMVKTFIDRCSSGNKPTAGP